MKDNKRTKRMVIVALIIIAVMVTAVVVLAQDYWTVAAPIKNDTWQVEFTSIVEGEKMGFAESRYHPWHTATNASFHVDFTAPGDSIVYDIQVSNRGTLDAVLSDIDVITNEKRKTIQYEIINLNEGDTLKSGQSKNFKIKISYTLHSETAETFSKPISLILTYVQDY